MDLTSNLIAMDPDEAEARAAEWSGLLGRGSTATEDRAIAEGYKALAQGKTLIRMSDMIRFAGVNNQDLPALAVAPTNAAWCYLRSNNREVIFTPSQIDHGWSWRGKSPRYGKGAVTVPWPWPPGPPQYGRLRAMVPVVPPRYRCRGWRSMHVLFEVERWEDAPRPPGDPALVEHLGGDLWVVHSTWDLTPLEQAVLAERGIR